MTRARCRFSVCLTECVSHTSTADTRLYFPSERNNITYHQLRLHRAWWLFYYISMTHFKRERVWCIHVKMSEEVTCLPQHTCYTENQWNFIMQVFLFHYYLMFAGFYPLRAANVCEKSDNQFHFVDNSLWWWWCWCEHLLKCSSHLEHGDENKSH